MKLSSFTKIIPQTVLLTSLLTTTACNKTQNTQEKYRTEVFKLLEKHRNPQSPMRSDFSFMDNGATYEIHEEDSLKKMLRITKTSSTPYHHSIDIRYTLGSMGTQEVCSITFSEKDTATSSALYSLFQTSRFPQLKQLGAENFFIKDKNHQTTTLTIDTPQLRVTFGPYYKPQYEKILKTTEAYLKRSIIKKQGLPPRSTLR